MKFLIIAALVALAAAEPPVNYGAPSSNYGAPSSNYGAPGGSSSGNAGGNAGGYNGAGGRQSAPIESDPNLELENEGANLPSDIIGQDLLDRVVDALSEDLAQQEAARNAQRGGYGAPNAAYGAPSGSYGAPSSGYGAPGGSSSGSFGGPGLGGGAGRIQLLIPPAGTDPLKARLIANYIQRTSAAYSGSGLSSGSGSGGYNQGGSAGGY